MAIYHGIPPDIEEQTIKLTKYEADNLKRLLSIALNFGDLVPVNGGDWTGQILNKLDHPYNIVAMPTMFGQGGNSSTIFPEQKISKITVVISQVYQNLDANYISIQAFQVVKFYYYLENDNIHSFMKYEIHLVDYVVENKENLKYKNKLTEGTYDYADYIIRKALEA